MKPQELNAQVSEAFSDYMVRIRDLADKHKVFPGSPRQLLNDYLTECQARMAWAEYETAVLRLTDRYFEEAQQ